MRLLQLLPLLLLLLPGCGPEGPAAINRADTTATDSLIVPADDSLEVTCYDAFFRDAEKVGDSNSVYVRLPGMKRMSLRHLLQEELLGHAQVGLRDLDGDGSREMVLFNYTGGAHCCDEFYVLTPDAQGTYLVRTKLFGGNSCINDQLEFSFDLYEGLGYFYTCYACLYTDTARGLMMPPPLQYRYEKGRFVQCGDSTATAAAALKNLELLQTVQMEKFSNNLDDGVRKMFAINLATLHFLRGSNWKSTRALFDQYYVYKKDAEEVWKEFRLIVTEIGNMNRMGPV
ncbi:MAG TPA: hypothetical protein PKE63_07750 [Lacibacter sp.]|nr:hypothetical protein [Lacibacter sp.]HMO89397.1 hypothetical protein [Lacibacter sp.]HMP87158.1 hypothetical protein [Lacibacter sp.]